MKQILLAIATTILVVILATVLFFGFAVVFNKGVCDRMTRLAPEYSFDFDFYGGCLVKLESGRWIEIGSVEYIEGRLEIVQP